MKIRDFMLIGLTMTALTACGDDDNNGLLVNNATANNTTANNTTANNTTANNTTANNTTANNTNGGNPLTCNADFAAADACGGDPTGVWTVTEACTNFDYAGQIQQACASAVVEDAMVNATGTLTVAANLWTQAITGDVSITLTTPDACGIGDCGLVQSALGFISTTATCVTDGGAGCDCVATFDAADVSAGTYTTANGVVTIDSGETYYYCASGGTLLLREFGTAVDEAQPTLLYSGQ